MSLGSCLVANEPVGIGQAMIKMRADGKSWKEIADEFNLPNPSAARKAFAKHTGIHDFKTKGPAIYDVKPGPAALTKKQADKIVKSALDAVPEASDLNDASAFINLGEQEADSLTGVMQKTGLTKDEVNAIKAAFDEGKGYTAIRASTGVQDFAKIDEVVWEHVLGKADGKVWKAYTSKPTSESGFKAVQDKVISLKQKGLTVEQIAGMPDSPPMSVIDAILKGDWKMPPMGATSPIIPPPPPPPPQVYTGPLASGNNFGRRTDSEMMEWINSLGNDLTSQQVSAISKYTGSGYTEINNYLRFGSSYSGRTPAGTIKQLDEVFRPIPVDTRVTRRISSTQAFGQDMNSLVGTVFADKGFLSTSIAEGVWSGSVEMIIDVPAGAPARYVRNISAHKSEYELLLPRETKMIVTRVEKRPGGYSDNWLVHLQVII